MKKILLAAFAGLFCFTACNDKATVAGSSKDNSQAQKNLEAIHTVNRAFETGDVSGIDSVVADDFVDHTDKGEVRGRDSLKSMIKTMHSTMKDMKMETQKELADNDYVFSWMRFTGTADGTMMPAGPYDMQAIEVVKFTNGKAVEHWEFVNMQDMMKMMGQQGMDKNAGPMPVPDSSKMKK